MPGKNPFDNDVDDDIFLQRRDNRPSETFQKPRYHNPNSGFFSVADDGNVDDDAFVNQPRAGRGAYMLPQHNIMSEVERMHNQRMQLMEETRRIEESSLQSLSRSVGMIHESEQVGIKTAEDLVRQGEQLQRVEDKLDDVDVTLTTTQRQINSIKSVFSQLKNHFSKGPETMPTSAKNLKSPTTEESQRKTSISENPKFAMTPKQEHPGLGVRGQTEESNNSRPYHQSVYDQQDEHLSDISLGLDRLKKLAKGLGDEIEEQNDRLNRINEKADRVDLRIVGQNKSMNRILKK